MCFPVTRRTKVFAATVSYPYFPAESFLCIARCLQAYLDHTSSVRSARFSQLLISNVCPFRLVSSLSLNRWVCWILSLSGAESSFSAHLVRGAAVSLVFSRGGKFYFRPVSQVAHSRLQEC